MEALFWIGLAGVAYAYVGYPLLLFVLASVARTRTPASPAPGVTEMPGLTLLIPAHNEAAVIAEKLDNSLSQEYPGELQVLVVSDGSSDATCDIVRERLADTRVRLEAIKDRKGKASALNRGLELATGDIVVFTDASIMLDRDALRRIAEPFADPRVGCVSGEDRIAGTSGEGLYGRYELFLRRQEAALGSLVGASGSFYAQRRELSAPFPEGLAPDFLSVLNTVRQGYRAIAEPLASGQMTAVKEASGEFHRKVRTAVRGMTALFANADLLNPVRFPLFSFFLWSHKVMRWAVPIFLLLLLGSSAGLAEHIFYAGALVAQLVFYFATIFSFSSLADKIRVPVVGFAQFFLVSNAAMLVAWVRYLTGFRQEIWGPSKRDAVR